MNKEIFLNCLEYAGVETGTSVVGLYSFSSGLSDACFNQIYSTGYNYYSGLPYDKAFPLVYLGEGNQPQGNFSFKNPYYINKKSGNFGVLISMNYSGCLNSSSANQILISSISGLKNNSGVVLSITPSNRLFFSVSGYSSTISEDIFPNDFAFLSLEDNRFVNFGLFNLKDNRFYNKAYDHGSETLNVEKLYFGGALDYNQYYTGYSGKLNEIYLFSGNLTNEILNSCVECVYATGYKYNPSYNYYTGIQITDSYWTGIKEIQITGYKKISGTHIKTDGSLRSFYYDSGITGEVQLYEALTPNYELIPYTLITSGIEFAFNTGKKYSETSYNLFFDLGLYSGDVVEIYTYPDFNSNLSLEIQNNEFPESAKEVQLFGNGLAETKDIDYSVAFDKQIEGFNSEDTLLYDLLTGSSVTVPFTTGYISTGGAPNNPNFYISISGISGVDGFQLQYEDLENPPILKFDWDIYLNGQKLSESINYEFFPESHGNYIHNHLLLYKFTNDISNFNNLDDPSEFKLVPLQKNPIKKLYLISGDSFYITGLNGFSEQVWKNGVRQKIGIDYFKQNVCRAENGNYFNPNYSFELFNSNNDIINNFIQDNFYLENHITNITNSLLQETKPLNSLEINSNQMFSFFNKHGENKEFIRNKGFFLSKFKKQLSCINVSCDDVDFGNVGLVVNSPYYIPKLNSKNCVAITSRHVLLAPNLYDFRVPNSTVPNQIKTGSNVYFLTENDQIISRNLKNVVAFTDNLYSLKDFVIGILDQDLPSEIEPCYILPSDYKDYFNSSPNEDFIYPESFACFCLDTYKCVYTQNLHSISEKELNFVYKNFQRKNFKNLMKYMHLNDAGSPFFCFLNDKLVLLSISNGKYSTNQGVNIANFISTINNAINTLNQSEGISNSYSLKQINLSNFDKKTYSPTKLNYLHDHLENNIFSGLDALDAINNPVLLFNNLTVEAHESNSYVRNSGHLAASLNEEFTCFSPYQEYDLDSPKYQRRHGTLITSRHLILADHFALPEYTEGFLQGEPLPENLKSKLKIKFISKNNTVYERRIVARIKVPNVFDLQIALLDYDLPSDIKTCYFLPDDFNEYILNVPAPYTYPSLYCIYLNQFLNISIGRLLPPKSVGYVANDSRFLTFFNGAIRGDSGSPIFFIINGKLVILGLWYSGFTAYTAGSMGDFLQGSEKINSINESIKKINLINNVEGEYEVKIINLNEFDKIEIDSSIFNDFNFNSLPPPINGAFDPFSSTIIAKYNDYDYSGFYTFDSGVNDDKNNINNLNISGNLFYVTGKFGSGINLNGSSYLSNKNSYIDLRSIDKPYYFSFWFYYDSEKTPNQNLFSWGNENQTTGIFVGLTGVGENVYPIVEYKNNNESITGLSYNYSILKNQWNYLFFSLYKPSETDAYYSIILNGNLIPDTSSSILGDSLIYDFNELNNYEFSIGKKIINDEIITGNCYFDDFVFWYDQPSTIFPKVNYEGNEYNVYDYFYTKNKSANSLLEKEIIFNRGFDLD